MPISKRRRVAFLGLAITLAILAVFIVRLDWPEFIATFRRIQPLWILLTCSVVLLSVGLRAVRWKVASTSPSSRFGLFWYATVIGYVGNMIYPARAGEAIRVVALCQSTQIPAGHAMASAFADRLADVFVLGAVALLVLGFQKIAPHDAKVMTASFVFAAVPILCFLGFVRWGSRLENLVNKIAARLPAALTERIPRWYGEAVAQTTVIQNPRVLTAVLGLTVLAACSDYLAIWFGMRAMGWFLPPVAAVVVGILIAMGTMIPAAPGYIGIYQVACVLGLAFYGISEASALAFSIVLQVAVLSVIALQGFAALAHYGWRIRNLDEHVLAAEGGSAEAKASGHAV